MKETVQDIHNWLKTAGNEFGDKSKLPLSIKLVQEEFDELKQAIKDNNRNEILDAISDLWVVLNNISFYYSIKPEEIEEYQQAVSKSNWSKFCASEKEAQQTVIAYSTGSHPDKPGTVIDAYYTKVNDLYIIKRFEDNKILKSIHYRTTQELL